MKITFAYGGAENLGIEYLSSILKHDGHKTHLSFDPLLFKDNRWIDIPNLAKIFNYDNNLIKNIKISKPDLVAFSVNTLNYQWSLSIAKKIKELLDVPIVFGGIHATSLPEKVIMNGCIDYAIIGEGEYALLDLVNCLESGKSVKNIKNIYLKENENIIKNKPRPLIQNLDSLPLPDKDLFFDILPIIKNDYSIMTSRGCPYNCTYCCNNVYRKVYNDWGKIRRRSVDNVIRELKIAKEKYRTKNVQFQDDAFTTDPKWINDFSKKYKDEINIPFRCAGIHPKSINFEIAKSLKDAGCYLMEIGVQNANEKIRRNILNRFETNQNIIDVAEVLKKLNIKFYVHHIFGIPSENEKDQIESAKLYNKIRPDQITCFYLSYFPKTEIINIAKSKGIIKENDINQFENGNIKLYFYPGKNSKMFFEFCSFFYLLPLLPKRLVDVFINKKLYKYLPKNRYLGDITMFTRSLIMRDKHASNYLKYYLYCYLKYYLLNVLYTNELKKTTLN